MVKYFLIITVFLFSQAIASSAHAEEVIYEPIVVPAKIRGDGMLMSDDALISGIRNPDDPRSDAYTFYYFGVDPEGNVSEESMYKVYQNPDVSWPDFLQETLQPVPIDDSKILAQSAQMRNAILTEEDRVYFNGERVESGDVLAGGVMTFVDGKLRYNGEIISSGTVVYRGGVVQ